MSVKLNDTRGDRVRTLIAPATPDGVVVAGEPAETVRLRATNVFHSHGASASHGVTLQPGDEFETYAPHGEDLIRNGLAERVTVDASASEDVSRAGEV